MNLAEMHARVTAAMVARLATVRADGAPHIVPICFALDPDTQTGVPVAVSIVDAKPKRSERLQRLDNVRAHPAISLLIDRYDDDWTQLWWVRIDGDAEIVEQGPTHDRAVELLTAKYPQYREHRPDGSVLRLRLQHWTGWSSGG
jgi:PPOX class probable F420-dependent enzyme